MEFHGRLLLGGMALKDLAGEIDSDDGHVSGRFIVDRAELHHLQVGRPYRLELDDGRAAQVVVSQMDVPRNRSSLQVEFDGLSPLS